jgi:serine/threonine-protein kinase RsbW
MKGNVFMPGYTVKINSTYEEVDNAVDEIIDFLQNNCNLKDEHLVFTINFTLRELLINAVEHGNKMVKEKEVLCVVSYTDNGISIDVYDEGNGFKLESRMSEIAKEDILRLRGRGIYIITKMGFVLNVETGHVKANMNFNKIVV